MKYLADLYRCFLLVWRYRRLRYGSVSGYAQASLQASELVGEMRKRYPGRRFFWSFSTNHVIDSNQKYVAVWEVRRIDGAVSAIFIFHGPCNLIRQKMLEGGFDAALNGCAHHEPLLHRVPLPGPRGDQPVHQLPQWLRSPARLRRLQPSRAAGIHILFSVQITPAPAVLICRLRSQTCGRWPLSPPRSPSKVSPLLRLCCPACPPM